MIPRRTFAAFLMSVAAAACAPGNADVDEAAPADAGAGMSTQEVWITLFDGTSTDAWRGYNREDLPAGWRAVDGALTMVEPAGDIITKEQFANFELELEWQVREGGNSGIFYRAVETSDPIYHSAPEMQVLDDARHADGASRLTAAGANYGLHPAPDGVVKPAGEWNAVRILVNGNHVEHWLNGQKIVEYELGSDDWRQRVANSKFNEWPAYGRAQRGHIGLQDHGDWVAYRNIRVRVLP
ncbi:MAG TPA: DUF1080 domain-containing protein [Longimicrobiales bacterium]